jgi:hypothetical protein
LKKTICFFLNYQSPPLLIIVGQTATVSTLVIVEGHPKAPTLAGKGGFILGYPAFPSRDSNNAYYKILIFKLF